MKTFLIETQKLGFCYPSSSTTILEGIDLHLEKGDILGIIGPNGGGKSTLLKILAGLYAPTKGRLLYRGEDYKKICSYSPITYLPQQSPHEILLPITLEEWLKIACLPVSIPSLKQIHQALEKVVLSKKPQTLVSQLSGGEYQRLLLAKAWLSQGEIILMDEPTKGLDGNGQDCLLLLIKELRKEKQVGIILIDHNIQQVLKHCDRILCLNKSFHWHDTRQAINNEILEKTYHCEFEHILIHERGGNILQHHHSQHHTKGKEGQ